MVYFGIYTETLLPVWPKPPTTRLTVWPNPAGAGANVVRLEASPLTGGRLLDATGRVVTRFTADASGSVTLSLHALPPGVYVVQAGGATSRLVVQ